MHAESIDHGDSCAEPRSGADTVSLPSSGRAGDLTAFERLQAFRELLRHGDALLGEVAEACRQAEASARDVAREQAAAALACQERDAARAEAGAAKAEILRLSHALDQSRRVEAELTTALEKALREARDRERTAGDELARLRADAASAQAERPGPAELAALQTRVRLAELALTDTRRALDEERGRRDRAIALIKPRTVVEVRA